MNIRSTSDRRGRLRRHEGCHWSVRPVELLEPRILLSASRHHGGFPRLHRSHARTVLMETIDGAPTGTPVSPVPAAGSSVNTNSSTIIIPFLDRRGVLNVYDSLRNRVVNTGQVATAITVDAFNQLVYFITAETAQGRDLDRDGRVDANDNILQVYNVATGRVTDTHLQVATRTASGAAITAPLVANTGSLTPLVAFLLSEPAAGRDFNNDGDTDDNVAVVYDPLHNQLMNSHQQADSFRFSNSILTFVTNEVRQGQDLNGDGRIQATDTVLQSYDPLSFLPFGKLSNFGKVVGGL